MSPHKYRYAAERIFAAFNKPFPEDFEFPEGDKLEVCLAVYERLSAECGRTLPWGIFTGVHPIRYIREQMNNPDLARFRISPEKISLALEIIRNQNISAFPPDTCHLYIGIPFCPSRCGYCSFVSQSVEKTAALIPQYMDCLLTELRAIAAAVKAERLTVTAVYIGGGTPTALPLEQLRRLFDCVQREFPLSPDGGCEYTVEAGRPETLTRDVLREIAASGANRISINPQSMNDAVLAAIGRRHSAADVYRAYSRARKILPADCAVNMDLIAGLPGESREDFLAGLAAVCELNPGNITVHSLAVKRAADFAKATEPTPDYTQDGYALLKERGYSPYYLYRQSNSAGDNIGYSRDGRQCLYNVYMMDESSRVFGAGCGAAARQFREDGRAVKTYNPKYPHEYIRGFCG